MRTNSDYQVSPLAGFRAILTRDLLLACRKPGDLLNPLVFFLIVVTMVPLGISPEREVLAALAPGLLWVMALLATLLSLDGLFRSDFDDGSLDQLLISPQPLYFAVLAKVTVHWLLSGLPLTLLAPLLGVSLALPVGGYWPLCLTLLLGTASMSLVGAVGAALTVSLQRGGLLLSLIVMPLYLPVLIFGASGVTAAVHGEPYSVHLAVLGAFLALALALAPLATAAALRVSSDG